jgi:hypothetical protein
MTNSVIDNAISPSLENTALAPASRQLTRFTVGSRVKCDRGFSSRQLHHGVSQHAETRQ